MLAVTESYAVKNLHSIIKEVNESSWPIFIATEDGLDAVILSGDDWRAIDETERICSVPGLRESIIEAGKEPVSECKVYDPKKEW